MFKGDFSIWKTLAESICQPCLFTDIQMPLIHIVHSLHTGTCQIAGRIFQWGRFLLKYKYQYW